MTTLDSLDSILEHELKDLYSAENQLLKALPKMAKAASTDSLREAFEMHLEETQTQVERLQKIGEILQIRLTGKVCKAMQGLIEEGKEVLEEDAENPALVDLLLIAAAQKIEHYEISGYGTVRTIAEELGHTEVVDLLQETLEEESATDEKLTSISEQEVISEASAGSESEEDEEEEEEMPKASSRQAGKKRGSSSESRAK